MDALRRLTPWLVGSCLAACGGESATQPPPADAAVADIALDAAADVALDAAVDARSDAQTADTVEPFRVAEHDPLTVIESQGGPVMAHPRLVLVMYRDDPNRDALEAHARWLVTSPWLHAVGDEYGVGDGSVLGVVHRDEDAPDAITDTAIASYLAAGIADGTLPAPPDGAYDDVLYVVYFPQHTVITQTVGASPQRSCESFGGYHYEAARKGGRFAYAVIPTCPVPRAFMGITPLENEELAVSHEVLEAATDPLPRTRPAYALPPSSQSPWLLIGSELADLCSLTLHLHRDGMFVAERSWSNAAARLGDRDPCVPADPGVAHFGITASPDTIQRVAGGESATFTLRGWSTARTADWRVVTTTTGAFTPMVTLDATTMNNGGTATMTVTVPRGTPARAEAIVYVYASHSQTDYKITPVAVRAL